MDADNFQNLMKETWSVSQPPPPPPMAEQIQARLLKYADSIPMQAVTAMIVVAGLLLAMRPPMTTTPISFIAWVCVAGVAVVALATSSSWWPAVSAPFNAVRAVAPGAAAVSSIAGGIIEI